MAAETSFHPRQLGAYLQLPCADIGRRRSELGGFEPPRTITLTSADFTALWPYVSNVWQVTRGSPTQSVARDWRCRYHRAPDASASTGKRRRLGNSAPRCKTRCSVVITQETVTVTFFGTHNHSMSTCDGDKLNDALRAAFRAYIADGFGAKPQLALEAWRGDAPSHELAKTAGLLKKADAQFLKNLTPKSCVPRPET
ncbi:uncharacterized protein B0I36DRAFT_362865 [Microdochium trichocladiopsis]|uniref:Uncharacterized protein n=1 Tax=Microdochium trichocladiopsis TaxID=1682393 RepID=A0A9P8Y739_9PEZI|nr:uncharacterized protein B0I36DRAFT_362865 [Microdochium trichocladiopsis]KAH7031123.1 hypothetical protein B0I36DRAFT_362865 [Microdochium trichocladiopsis]